MVIASGKIDKINLYKMQIWLVGLARSILIQIVFSISVCLSSFIQLSSKILNYGNFFCRSDWSVKKMVRLLKM